MKTVKPKNPPLGLKKGVHQSSRAGRVESLQDAQAKDFELQLSTLQRKYEALSVMLHSSQDSNLFLQAEVSALRNRTVRLTDESKQTEKVVQNYERLESTKNEMEKTLLSTTAEYMDFKKQHVDCKAIATKLKQQQTKLSLLQQQHSSLQKQQSQLVSSHSHCDETIQELHRKLTKSNATVYSTIEKQTVAEKLRKECQLELDNARISIRQAQSYEADLTRAHEQTAGLQNRVESLTTRVQLQSSQILDLTNEVQAERDEKSKLQEQEKVLLVQLADATSTKRELANKVMELKNISVALETLEAAYKSLEHQHAKAQGTITALTFRAEEGDQARLELGIVTKDKHALSLEQSSLKKKLSDMVQQVAAINDNFVAETEKNVQLRKQHRQVMTHAQGLDTIRVRLGHKMHTNRVREAAQKFKRGLLEARINRLVSERDDLRSKHQKSLLMVLQQQKAAREARARTSFLRFRLAATEITRRCMLKLISQRKRTAFGVMQAFQSQVMEKKNRAEEQQRMIANLQNDLEEKMESVQASEHMKKKILDRLADAKEQLARQELLHAEHLAEHKQERESLQTQFDELLVTFQDQTKELGDIKNKLDVRMDLETSLEVLRSQYRFTRDEHKKCSNKIDPEIHAALKTELDESISSYKKLNAEYETHKKAHPNCEEIISAQNSDLQELSRVSGELAILESQHSILKTKYEDALLSLEEAMIKTDKAVKDVTNLRHENDQRRLTILEARNVLLDMKTPLDEHSIQVVATVGGTIKILGLDVQSPFAHAGMSVGDVILEVNCRETKTSDDFTAALRSIKPADTVPVLIYKNRVPSAVMMTVNGEGYTIEETLRIKQLADMPSSSALSLPMKKEHDYRHVNAM